MKLSLGPPQYFWPRERALALYREAVHWPLDILTSAIVSMLIGSMLAAALPVLVGPQRLLSRRLPGALVAEP